MGGDDAVEAETGVGLVDGDSELRRVGHVESVAREGQKKAQRKKMSRGFRSSEPTLCQHRLGWGTSIFGWVTLENKFKRKRPKRLGRF